MVDKLDIQNELAELDSGNVNFWNELNPAEQKQVSPYVLMRWFSAVGQEQIDFSAARAAGRKKGDGKGKWPSTTTDASLTGEYVEFVNDLVNLGFWSISKHQHLQLMLLALIGKSLPRAKADVHIWIPNTGRVSKTPLLDALLYEIDPYINDQELSLWKSKLDDEEVGKICEKFGRDGAETKKVIQEARKANQV